MSSVINKNIKRAREGIQGMSKQVQSSRRHISFILLLRQVEV